jgi:nucleoside-diphosphate-sugar epimerase
MRVFVAGATGVLGRALVPRLVAAGHEVVGMTRSAAKQDLVRGLGARPVVADALDPDAVAQAVASAEPEVIVHQLTALSGDVDMRHIDRFFAATNRLRTEATDHLLAAGHAVGARRFVAQSFAGWPAARTGGPVKGEDAPFDPDPPKQLRGMLAAIRHLEEAVIGADGLEGVVLRYGGFYGPGTTLSADPAAAHTVAIRKRRFPVVGDGGGMWSFIHVDDAADATAVAVERGRRGIFSVVDDDPAPARDWLPELARALGADPPRRVPRWIGRLLAGEAATVMMTEVRGASNAKAKRELGWTPRYASWRQGFAHGLG